MIWQKLQLLLCWLGETQCCDDIEFHRQDSGPQL